MCIWDPGSVQEGRLKIIKKEECAIGTQPGKLGDPSPV